ncbi:L-lactate dehydrogenase [Bacillus sp. SG-1]|nr:L-lactate dehydrogenase [Bacillus sp. SG-1]
MGLLVLASVPGLAPAPYQAVMKEIQGILGRPLLAGNLGIPDRHRLAGMKGILDRLGREEEILGSAFDDNNT